MMTFDDVQAALRREQAASAAYEAKLAEYRAMLPVGSAARPSFDPVAAVAVTPEAREYDEAAAELARLQREAAKQRPPRARGNPPESPWRDGGPRASRGRKPIELTLSADGHVALERLAARHGGNRSAAAEEAILSRSTKIEIRTKALRAGRTVDGVWQPAGQLVATLWLEEPSPELAEQIAAAITRLGYEEVVATVEGPHDIE